MNSQDRVDITGDMPHGQRLFYHVTNTGSEEPHFLTFRGLNRLNILRLQNELAQLKSMTWEEKALPAKEYEHLTTLLHQYVTAIRDYEYIRKLSPATASKARTLRLDAEQAFEEVGALPEDPGAYVRFGDLNTVPSDPLRDALKRVLPKTLTYTRREIERRKEEYLDGCPPEEVSPFVDSLARFMVAFVAGAALVVPMLVMSLPNVSLAKSLVTVSGALVLFAGGFSVGLRANNTETMMATATYAAVLVVFVGTTT